MTERLLPASEDIGVVYAMKCTSYVKIGWTKHTQKRLSQIRSCNPRGVHLLGTVKGDVGDEYMLHLLLRPAHHRGEWFKYDGLAAEVCERFEKSETAKDVIKWIEGIREERTKTTEERVGKEWWEF